jgi:hypothetical protein
VNLIRHVTNILLSALVLFNHLTWVTTHQHIIALESAQILIDQSSGISVSKFLPILGYLTPCRALRQSHTGLRLAALPDAPSDPTAQGKARQEQQQHSMAWHGSD